MLAITMSEIAVFRILGHDKLRFKEQQLPNISWFPPGEYSDKVYKERKKISFILRSVRTAIPTLRAARSDKAV